MREFIDVYLWHSSFKLWRDSLRVNFSSIITDFQIGASTPHPIMKHLGRFLQGTLMGILHACHAEETTRVLPFQARLYDGAGSPLADGAKIVQFQIYGEPIGGNPLWAGEVHRLSVKSGLVNVLLGSKNPLPLNLPTDDSVPFFGTTLFLQIKIDSNDNSKIDDADDALTPRQAILPVLFASESQTSRNALKLAGHDWSSILENGATNPASGKLDGSKISPGSISNSQLKTGAVDGRAIANLEVGPQHMADASIPFAKLAPRPIAPNVQSGGIAISPTSLPSNPDAPRQGFQWNSSEIVNVPGLEVLIQTTGRPIVVTLLPGVPDANRSRGMLESQGEPWDAGSIRVLSRGGGENYGHVYFVVDDRQVAAIPMRAGPVQHLYVNPGSLSQVIQLPAGPHTIKVQISYFGGSAMEVHGVRLMAMEL